MTARHLPTASPKNRGRCPIHRGLCVLKRESSSCHQTVNVSSTTRWSSNCSSGWPISSRSAFARMRSVTTTTHLNRIRSDQHALFALRLVAEPSPLLGSAARWQRRKQMFMRGSRVEQLPIATLMGPAIARSMGPGEEVERPSSTCHDLMARVEPTEAKPRKVTDGGEVVGSS